MFVENGKNSFFFPQKMPLTCIASLADMRADAKDYITPYYCREFILGIFYDSPNRQIKVLAKFSHYTVGLESSSVANSVMTYMHTQDTLRIQGSHWGGGGGWIFSPLQDIITACDDP